MKTFAYDFETYYSKEYSIRDLGNWAYVNHPEFDAYMLAVSTDEGEWVGNPKDFSWELFHGQRLIAHNAGFEAAVTWRLKELGIIPKDVEFGELLDTADMAAYLGVPRSLEQAAKSLLNVSPDKTTRGKACGQRWQDMTSAFQDEMTRYAGQDAILERRLFLEHGHKWPEHERLISRLTREMCARGLPVNRARIEEGIAILEDALVRTRERIPWTANNSKTPALSPKAFRAECEKHQITAPASLAKTSEEFDAWLKEHGATLPWARAIGELRSINMKLKKLITMHTRTRPDMVMPYALKYCGAHTLRDSGDSGFNPQNLDRLPFFIQPDRVVADDDEVKALVKAYKSNSLPEGTKAIDMRAMIEAPEGYKLGVADLSAIEPCCTVTLAGDEAQREMLEAGMDPYEAQARADGEYSENIPLKDWDKEHGTGIRQYNKVKVLGCGYGAGPEKVQYIAKTMVGLELTLEETQKLVYKFRSRKFIPGLWGQLERDMRKSVGGTYSMELPNGRLMNYIDVKGFGGLSAVIPRNGRFMRLGFWGGTLTENIVQASARDVFMDRMLAVAEAGYDIRLRVHDELVLLFKDETAEEDLRAVVKIMSTKPSWWPELPIAADGHLCQFYQKG